MKKIFCIIPLLLILTACGEKVATVSKDEFEQLKEGMTYDEVKTVVGGKAKSESVNSYDEKLVTYKYDAVDGVETDATVSLLFNDGKLDVIMERGLFEREELSIEEQEALKKHQENINNNVAKKSVEEIIINTIGEKNNQEKDYIDIVEVENSNLKIVLNGSDNFSSNMIKGNMLMKSVDILKEIENEMKYQTISVNWKYPLIDTYGNKNDEVVLSFVLNRETLNKINWENFDYNNFKSVSTNYYEHPALNK